MVRSIIGYNLLAGLQSLRHSPLRSFLTILGIVVGIAAVVTVLAIGKGHEAEIEARIQQMGTLWFWIEPKHFTHHGFPRRAGQQATSNQIRPLSFQDADAIIHSCSAVEWAAPIAQYASQVKLQNTQTQLDVIATTPHYQKVKSLPLVSGRYLTPSDLRYLRKVCIVEEQTGLYTFGGPLKYIQIQGHKFQVIGIFKRPFANAVPFRTMTVHIPLTTAEKVLGINSVDRIDCKAREGKLEQAIFQVQETLRRRLQGNLVYELRTARDLFRHAEAITQTATLVTAGIGMLSLIVGGIGIMNILLASVLERTHEVGLRKAVGARKKDILLQFISESSLFSMFGGFLGIIFGIFFQQTIGHSDRNSGGDFR